ncbi:hypothetical protein JCM11641_006143 [Rhodosporidiobolus odoratus]
MVDPAVSAASDPTTSSKDSSDLSQRVAAYSANILPPDYAFDPTLSLDENYLVLTFIYARLSMSKRGNMACIIVNPLAPPAPAAQADTAEPPAKRARLSPSPSSVSSPHYPGRILAHSNNFPQPTSVASPDPSKKPPTVKKGRTPAQLKANQSLFLAKANNAPELHAEARSICLAASQGIPLAGSTAYVSFPPCQACLPLLVAAGVKRLVYRQKLVAQGSVELCERSGVECVELTDKEQDERLRGLAGKWWKEKGEGKEETRARLDRWWAEQEKLVMGSSAGDKSGESALEVETTGSEGKNGEGNEGAGAPPLEAASS